jgi:hypothetical protein
MGTLHKAEAFVAQLDALEKDGTIAPLDLAAAAANELEIVIGSRWVTCHVDVPPLVARLLPFHRRLSEAPADASGSTYTSDMGAYYWAFDTEWMALDHVAARVLWEQVIRRQPSWPDYGKYPHVQGPRAPDDYRGAARLGLAANLAQFAPTDLARAEALLKELESGDGDAAHWSRPHQAALCYRAELAALQGNPQAATKLYDSLEPHVVDRSTGFIGERRQQLAELIAAKAR